MILAEFSSFAELDEKDRRRRKRELRRAVKKLVAMLANPLGLERLRAITDEEWEAALAEDELSITEPR